MRIDLSLYGSTVHSGMKLCESIHRHGYEAYLVGGCVRDIVMETIGVIAKANIHDVDIATNMPIEQLRKYYVTADNNGEAHGTILVRSGDTYFEVTQFRTDGAYSDGRHPDTVNFTKSFKEDTARRDFTINAMGIDYDGNVIDYNGGIEDIKNGVIRTVGDPVERFSEDALRIVRAMRFAARFKFTIDNATRNAFRTTKHRLANIAMERISDELKKCIHYGHSEIANMWSVMVSEDIFTIVDPKGYIDATKACNMLAGRAIRAENHMGEFFTELGTWTCILYNSDLKNAYQHYKLENDIFKCTQWCSNHLEAFHKFGEDIVQAVEMVDNRYFNQLRELDDAVTGHLLNFAAYKTTCKIASFVTTYKQNSVLSSAVAKCGYQGKAFGEMLSKLKHWHYMRLLANLYYEEDAVLEHLAIEYIKSLAAN